MLRQIILDTETTGLDPAQGHKIIEIGCIELIDRQITQRHYQQYINPQRAIDEGAVAIHGLTQNFLADKPKFAEIAAVFLDFIKGAELIIHNAPFDIAFLNHEFKQLPNNVGEITDYCGVFDTLPLARRMFPGQKNNLDALCKRYQVDNTNRDLHGALLDARLLTSVYLLLTGGQSQLFSDTGTETTSRKKTKRKSLAATNQLLVMQATKDERNAHQQRLQAIAKSSKNACLWPKEEEIV